jgi:glycosyltransferase involved in cell wall biosynthesis
MQLNTNPLVSIIIPCHNLEGYIETCLNSCLLQSYKDIEIVVVNDGSTDASKAIVEAYARQDKRIRGIHKPNEGVALARRTGVLEATGAYVFFFGWG